MRYDNLLEAISDDQPCGPDLDETGDDDYLNYTFAAEERLPSRFFDAETGAPFDRSNIDLKAEIKQIAKLLDVSRDLRLLCLDARFHALAGQISGFSESIQISAKLLEKFWPDVHPVGDDGNYFMRQNTLETLASRITVLLPLQFATLITDKRNGALTFRQHAIATGEIEPREGESTLDGGSIAAAFSNEVNASAIGKMHATITTTIEALASIRNSFIENSGFEYAPSFDDLNEELERCKKFLEIGQPSLAGEVGANSDDELDIQNQDSADEANGTSVTKIPTIPTSLSNGTKITISDQQSATRALVAAEAYFAAFEPSAPALILVHQAKELVGKPLVEALMALLPEKAQSAIIKLDSTSRFELNMTKMLDLSKQASSSGPGSLIGPKLDEVSFNAASRLDATALILAVEGYYRSCEPSSPVPLLLSKARGYLSKDFNAIIKDLINQEEDKA